MVVSVFCKVMTKNLDLAAYPKFKLLHSCGVCVCVCKHVWRGEINVGPDTMKYIVWCGNQISWELIRRATSKIPKERIGEKDERKIGFSLLS